MDNNILFFGDNLDVLNILKTYYNLSNKIDLIYIDPPFATGNDFLWSNDRVRTISSSLKKSEIAYSDKFTLEEYISYMEMRIKIMYELLSNNGSFYYHIDDSKVHYVKIMLDKIFGIDNFKSDIIRIKCNPKNFKRNNYGNIKDHILFFTKSNNYIWNNIEEEVPDEELNNRFTKIDSDGRNYTTVPIHAPGETKNGETNGYFMGQLPPIGRHWRYSPKKLEELYNQGLIEVSKNGNMRLKVYKEDKNYKKIQDIWTFKDPQNPSYPTQKNNKLLELIIKNSSNENSIVLDAFAGSGVTLFEAEKLNRRWIGIDKSEISINNIKKKLDIDLFQSYKFISCREHSNV
ncbi:site-specific DNA-methyltransferase [Brachyspira murdochii]|uniref:site-specific DNA-methyltransferase n=1 Tax=Brachyspira murdochii TaxID=84378 RepID=UPI0012F49186|nr:site-specific DNA-methyltransferase [Brachyspira murdochii]